MKKGDLIIGLVALLLMLSLGIGYYIYIKSMGNDRYVNIYIDQKLYKSVKLTEDTDIIVIPDNPYGYNKIRIHNNGVEVIEADCPNLDDVRQGFVRMPGIPIICVPHHLKIIIEGDTEPINDVQT